MLNLLVIEDLAMAVYLPVVAALIVGGTVLATLTSVAVALVAVSVILLAALRYGRRISDLVAGGSDETFLLTVFGITLLVAGIAQQLEVSGAIGAFLVGLALSGRAEERANELISPLRDLFAATFFLFFSFQIDPADLVDAAIPALVLTVRDVAHQGGNRLVRSRPRRRRAEGPDASRHRADRPRRVLDRDRSARIQPRQRPRTRSARGRLRAARRRSSVRWPRGSPTRSRFPLA